MARLARNLMRGPEVDPDRDAALIAFRKAAATGSRAARLGLAAHIYYDHKKPELADEARVLLDALVADDADGQATLLLGHFHSQGFGVPKDTAKSLGLHRESAARGNANAMFELSVLLSIGDGVAPDPKQAREWVRKAAEAGHARAMYNMGAFAATGNGTPKDLAEAVRWYRGSSEAGNGRATFTLALMTMNGEGIEADDAAAEDLLELARSQGFDVDGALGA
ncbi:MAG: tetratricopeptide repeat protein [Myxococcaceae bacterium]